MIREMILSRRAKLVRPAVPGAAVTESEVQWIVYTVALAILNPSEFIFDY